MEKITIFLAALLLVFAAGCREDASLDGLESQTKEEGTSVIFLHKFVVLINFK